MNARMPGRPKDLEKRAAIIDAAQGLFSERGVEGVSIEAIAAASGVSKVTVYNHFPDKAAIFKTMILRETDRLGRLISETTAPNGTLEERLNQFGVPLLRMLNEPCHVALDRTMAIEAQRNPEIGQLFFNAGPGRTLELLTELLVDAQARGEIELERPDAAARDLMALWFGLGFLERKYLPQTDCGDTGQLCSQIERGTKVFLRAYSKR
jgi:TetR/AcrR family transcriptional repressor of mexJK operon